jgi:nucleoside-diphosphate-sugar epimerase
MFHRLYGTPAVIARLFMTYGPGQAANKVIPSTILALLRGERPRLSSGERPLDWIFVADAIEGLLAVAQAEAVEGATIDVGSGRVATLRTVVGHLVELVAPGVHPEFGALPDRPFTGAVAADAQATHARLGWRATTSLRAGLEQTVGWYAAAAVHPVRPACTRQEARPS